MSEATTTADDLARVRAEIRARREALLRERIRTLHTCNRDIPVKRIAALTGVSVAHVEEVTGEKSPPGDLSEPEPALERSRRVAM